MKGFMCITLETIKIFHDKNEMDKFLGSKQEIKVYEKGKSTKDLGMQCPGGWLTDQEGKRLLVIEMFSHPISTYVQVIKNEAVALLLMFPFLLRCAVYILNTYICMSSFQCYYLL